MFYPSATVSSFLWQTSRSNLEIISTGLKFTTFCHPLTSCRNSLVQHKNLVLADLYSPRKFLMHARKCSSPKQICWAQKASGDIISRNNYRPKELKVGSRCFLSPLHRKQLTTRKSCLHNEKIPLYRQQDVSLSRLLASRDFLPIFFFYPTSPVAYLLDTDATEV